MRRISEPAVREVVPSRTGLVFVIDELRTGEDSVAYYVQPRRPAWVQVVDALNVDAVRRIPLGRNGLFNGDHAPKEEVIRVFSCPHNVLPTHPVGQGQLFEKREVLL